MIHDLYPAVILAGGLATRLRPVTTTIPKSLISINGTPFISHQLRLLHKQGIRHVVLCVGFLGEMVEDYVGDGRKFGIHVEYAYDGDKLLGTGGAIRKALPKIGSEAFFILYGDSYLTCDYAAIQGHFLRSQKQALMTVFHNEGKWDTSNIEFSAGEIINYDKVNRNARMHFIDYGVGMCTQAAIKNLIPKNESYDLAAFYQACLQQGALAAFQVSKRFYEVGSFKGIEELESHLAVEV